MLIYEYKLDGNQQQYAAIEEAIRIVQFIRNKCLRKWMDGHGVSQNDLLCYCAVLAQEYSLPHSSIPRPVRLRLSGPGQASPASTRTVRKRNPVRKAIPVFNMTIVPSNTKQPGDAWSQMANTSPLPMIVGLARFGWSATKSSR